MGISQSEMANLLGISQQVYGNIEKGKTKKIGADIYNKYLQLIKDDAGETEKDVTKDEKITALMAGLKIITLEVMQLRSRATGESFASIQLEYERLIEAATGQ